jgi:hypothetical protein
MSGMCPSCPNRHQADTLEALASAAEGVEPLRALAPVLRARAMAIRAAGCQWWQILPVKEAPGYIEGCMATELRRYLQAYGEDILLASDIIQADRNEQDKALKEVDRIAAEIGAGETIGSLAQLGLRAAVGRKIVEATEGQRALDGTPGTQ